MWFWRREAEFGVATVGWLEAQEIFSISVDKNWGPAWWRRLVKKSCFSDGWCWKSVSGRELVIYWFLIKFELFIIRLLIFWFVSIIRSLYASGRVKTILYWCPK